MARVEQAGSRAETLSAQARGLFGTMAGAVAIALGAVFYASGSGVLAVVLALAGIALVVRSLAPLLSAPREQGREEELALLGPGETRLRCPCCGAPTIDRATRDPSCVLCEWGVDGDPQDPTPADAAALEDARANFRRFLSIYPPDARPGWSPLPPAEEELALKRELVPLYAQAVQAGASPDRQLWPRILELEHAIEHMELEEAEAEDTGQVDEPEELESPEELDESDGEQEVGERINPPPP